MSRPVPKIVVGGRTLSRFIQWPSMVRDNTPRCIRCGQIDDEPYHLHEYCAPDGKQRYAKDHPA